MKWIWSSDACENNCYVNFVKTFDIADNNINSASIKIAADSEYVLYINGELVGVGQYDDFPPLYTYDTYQIEKHIKTGNNKLEIFAYYQGSESFQYKRGEAGICYMLNVNDSVFVSDKNTLCAVSKAFKNGEDVHKTTHMYGYGFVCDARGFGNEEYKESIEKPLPTLQKRPIEKCYFEDRTSSLVAQGTFISADDTGHMATNMMNDFLSSRFLYEIFESDKETVKFDGNVYAIYDLGINTSGYFTMDIDAEEGTIVDISYGEHVDDMRVRAAMSDYSGATRLARCFANRYICREGDQSFAYYYRRISGRYIELHIKGKVRSIKNVKIIGSFYPVNDVFKYDTNDNLLKKIFEVSKYTLRMCMHEHFEDCPWREQALYGSDSRNQMLFAYHAFNEYKFSKESLRLLAKSIGDDGIGTITAPTDCPKYKIPSFTFIWLLAMREYIDYSGDKSLAEEYLPLLKMIVSKRLAEISDGLAMPPSAPEYWNFYEWNEKLDGEYKTNDSKCVKDALYAGFFYLGLSSIAKIMEYLGENEESKKITDTLVSVKNKINEIFYDDKRGVYATFIVDGKKDVYAELTQTIMLYTKIAEGKEQRLIEILTGENDLIKSTLSYLIYKYDVLLSYGEKYKQYVYDDIIKKWGKMLYMGATTFWETESGSSDFDNAGSLCHGWSATPLYVFGKYFN